MSVMDTLQRTAQPRAAEPRTTRSSHSRTTPSHRNVLPVVIAAFIGLVLLGAGAFWATGGRWFTVRTPSMGGAAPVGSLVLTVPTSVSGLHVGDVVAFNPPTERGVTYTHRVIAVAADGITTRGDINGTQDPWKITDHDLVGRVASITPGIGWALRALPLLLIGALLVWALTRWWVSPANRGPVRMAGAAFTFAIAALILKPFVGVAQLASVSDPDGTSHITVVSTGLLPVRLTPAAGHGTAAPVDLPHAGHEGVSNLTGGSPGQKYLLDTHLHLDLLQLIVIVTICLLPLLWTLLVGFRPVAPARHSAPSRHQAVPA